jgi:hypothetical protein
LANVLQNSAVSTNVEVSDIFDLLERRNIFWSLYLSKNAKITLRDCAYNGNINISNEYPCAEKKHHTNIATNQYGQFTDEEYQEDDRL